MDCSAITKFLMFQADEAAVLQFEAISSPGDSMTQEACDPDGDRNQVAHGKQPEISQYLAIFEHASPDNESHGKTRHRSKGKRGPGPWRGWREGDRQESPHQSKCCDEPDVASGPRVAHAAGPAQLMGEESAQIIGRKMRLDDYVGKPHLQAEIGDSPAQFVIVSKKVDDRSESADADEISLPKCQGRTKPEVKPTFELAGDEHSGNKVCADAQ